MGHFVERRCFRRFSLKVPALFRWTDSSEHYEAGQGANVGLGGMFIFAAKCPPVGVQVEVEFVIPAFDRISRELRFRCVGEVSRVEACYQIAGFAVAGRIESHCENQKLEDMAVTVVAKQ